MFSIFPPKWRCHRRLILQPIHQQTFESDKNHRTIKKLSFQIKQKLKGFHGVGEEDGSIRSFNSRNSGKNSWLSFRLQTINFLSRENWTSRIDLKKLNKRNQQTCQTKSKGGSKSFRNLGKSCSCNTFISHETSKLCLLTIISHMHYGVCHE